MLDTTIQSDKILEYYTYHLQQSISILDSLSKNDDVKSNRKLYIKARKHFKYAEPILAFTDLNNYKSLNAPNILGIQGEDASDIKVVKPFGFQVIEELLFGEDIDSSAFNLALIKTNSRLKLIHTNAKLDLKNYHLLWLIKNQIVRIATMGISGFDSPVLNQSLLESQYTYETLQHLIELHENYFGSKHLYKEIRDSFGKSKEALNHDFDTFDRYSFIKNHIHPQLKLLVELQKDWTVNFPFKMALSDNLTSLFTKESLNIDFFSDYKSDTIYSNQKKILGKQLFNDTSLSKDYDMACATCHIKEKGFTDGKITFDKNQIRNTPTLTYSSYQQSFFMDGRSGSLEGQVIGVVENHNEFNTSMDSIVKRVTKNSKYKDQIDSLYQNKRMSYNIRHAIATYIRSLNQFNSKFDRNINGLENTLTSSEKNGFNLFTGKALCSTCHFAPVFNGTVPPNFADTEMEAIGVPASNDTISVKISKDLGRYYVYKTEERKHFFKTPTVRNAALTVPYMHNGVYNTLEEVVDFYNRGGGQGIGIDLPNQTLPFDNLNLTEQEQKDLVAFIKTLTDAPAGEY